MRGVGVFGCWSPLMNNPQPTDSKKSVVKIKNLKKFCDFGINPIEYKCLQNYLENVYKIAISSCKR